MREVEKWQILCTKHLYGIWGRGADEPMCRDTDVRRDVWMVGVAEGEDGMN